MRREPRAWLAALALCATLAAGRAEAQASDNGLHGRLELQDALQVSPGDSLDAALGAREANDALANLRLIWEPTWGRWSFALHDVLSVQVGPSVAIARSERTLIPEPPTTLLNLTATLADHDRVLATDTIDRLSVAYGTPALVVRVGRQAITWGSGLVFRPMDLFDPFSPTATDTEYKPGVDMIYVQRLFPGGSDLQVIVAPLPAVRGGPVTAEASAVALHFETTIAGHQTTLLLAHDDGDWVAGLGVNGALGGATWNVELVPTFLRSGGTAVSGLANISDAITLGGKNATVFAEYFHNGFGVVGPATVATLPPDLLARLNRGQIFNVRRDYLAGGLTLEATPLLTLSPSIIVDVNDGSLFLLFAATYSLADNASLIAGVQAPIGPAGSEFGGLPISPINPLLLSPPGQVYLQLRRYF